MKSYNYFTWLAGGMALCCLATANPVQAQVSSDGTLPTPTNVTTSDNLKFSITGGTQAGNNLFHSFRDFSVPLDGSVVFSNPTFVENIISRVTGGLSSNINGLIQANNTANLFLINPNGIIFGRNASLNIGMPGSRGSFLATTASSLLFTDGTQFSATASQKPTLLTISVPMGLQFGQTPGEIRTQNSELGVGTNSSLVLVGGNLNLEGRGLERGGLLAPAGRIELGSVAGPALVSLTSINGDWVLGYEGVQNFQDIKLSNRALVNTSVSNNVFSNEGSGDIQVQGKRVELTDGSVILSLTGDLPGGTISIQSENLILRNGSRVTASTRGAGRAGDLSVTSDSIELIGISDNSVNSSGLFTQSLQDASGDAGDLVINTRQLIIQNGAQVGASTFTAGDAGNLVVNALDGSVEVIGRSIDGSPASSLVAQSVGGKATGNAGSLEINTRRLSVKNGARISVGAVEVTNNGDERQGISQGEGGDLRINASDYVEVIGTGTNEQGLVVPSTLLAESQGPGAAGNLTIETGRLTVLDGAKVNVNSTGTGNAGDLHVNAHSIRLGNQGKLTAQSASGIGGNITLQAQDLLLLRGNSNISTTAGTPQTSGTGGTINIFTDNLVALQDSDIDADAFGGSGGQVRIKAQGIFGTQARDQQTSASDITASSNLGPQFSGTVTIDTLDVDPSKGLVTLPAQLVDNMLIATGCAGVEENKFIVTGRGGLPPNPSDTISSDTVWSDLRYRTQSENLPISESTTQETNSTPEQLVEAQGWVINNKGEVVLTATAPTVTPHSPGLPSAQTCRTP